MFIHIHGIVDPVGRATFLEVLWRLQDIESARPPFENFLSEIDQKPSPIITTLRGTIVEIEPMTTDQFRIEGTISLEDYPEIKDVIDPTMWTTEDEDDVFGPLIRGETTLEILQTPSKPTWPCPSRIPPR